jgi:hypothetical protein
MDMKFIFACWDQNLIFQMTKNEAMTETCESYSKKQKGRHERTLFAVTVD